LIPCPWWQYHGYLGLGLVLHIQGQYEEPRRIGKKLLSCKEQLKTFTIGKLKDHDKGTNTIIFLKTKLKSQANLLTIQVLLKPFGGGKSKLSKSIIRHLCSRVGTSTNGSSTSMKTSMLGSRTSM